MSMESHSRTNPAEVADDSVSSENSKSDSELVGVNMFSARDYVVFDTSGDSSKNSTIPRDAYSSSTVASSEDLITFHDSHVQLRQLPTLKDGDETLSQTSDLTHSAYQTPTRSPPSIQVMERSDGYNPSRIPASVFSSNSKTPLEWSITSNESLFSIHVGRIASFSGDHFTKMGRDELTKSAELIAYGSAPPVKIMEIDGKRDGMVKSVESGGEAVVLIKNGQKKNADIQYKDNIVARGVPIKKKKGGWSCCSCSSCRWTFCSCKWPFRHCCNRIWAFWSCKWPRCHCSSCSWKCCSLKYCSCELPSCCSSCSCPKRSSCSCPSCSSCSLPKCSSCSCPSCCSNCSWNWCSCSRPRCCCKWPTFDCWDCSNVFSNCWNCTGKKQKSGSKCACFSCCSRPRCSHCC